MSNERLEICYKRLGLKINPFALTPDTQLFYPGDQYKNALKKMHYGAENCSINIITGEIGTGKTLLCRYFLQQVKSRFATAYIFNPLQSERDLLRDIYLDLGGRDIQVKTIGEWYKSINQLVIQHAKVGKQSVIVVDEAHRLSTRALEILRLLTNLETERRKLLTVILVGQRELESKLEDINLKALKQRIGMQILLKPLARQDVKEYINFRLSAAGANSPLFSATAIQLLALISRGIPRIINKVAERALLAIFINEVFQAGSRDVLRSYYETRNMI